MIETAYLQPGRFVESDDPAILALAARVLEGADGDPVSRAIRLYYAVRDGVAYDPYIPFNRPESYSARQALACGRAFCVPKAALLAAVARAAGIPARLGFADVKNHLATPRLIDMNGGDVFHWHAYTELYLDGRWVKSTPAFDLPLCERFGVLPLDFDGRTDSIFHPFDRFDRKHMDYVLDRGTYADVPFDKIVATMRVVSPKLLDEAAFAGSRTFAAEAAGD